MKWKKLEVNLMLLLIIKKQMSIFFMIVHLKALKVAEVFLMITKL